MISHKFDNIFEQEITGIIQFNDDFTFVLGELDGTWRVTDEKTFEMVCGDVVNPNFDREIYQFNHTFTEAILIKPKRDPPDLLRVRKKRGEFGKRVAWKKPKNNKYDPTDKRGILFDLYEKPDK